MMEGVLLQHRNGLAMKIAPRYPILTILCLLILMLAGPSAFGQSIIVEKGKPFEPKDFHLPYAFYNQSFGASIGFVYGSTGHPQKQMTALATLIAGSNDTLALYGIVRDIQTPFLRRLFVDADLALGTFGTNASYSSGNTSFRNATAPAGSNDSDKENFIEGRGKDYLIRAKFRYLLPIGHGKDSIITTQVLDRGILVEGTAGGTSWNPLKSGKTFLEMRPFWREQIVDSDDKYSDRKTNGIDVSFFWENTDLAKNPSAGNTLRFRYTKDWGWMDSSNAYDVVDGEISKYISLGASDWFRQRVLALDVWTANAISWKDFEMKDGQVVYHRPPPYAGSMLGGMWRMRGYPASRFNDQAAIYYAAELRLIPQWRPFLDNAWVRKHLDIAWWQVVPFVEIGRVAPTWDIQSLHSNMKYDAGVGLRLMIKSLVARIDVAASPEGYGVQMMVGHPFQF